MNRRDWLASMVALVALPAWLKPRVVNPVRVGAVDFYVGDFARVATFPAWQSKGGAKLLTEAQLREAVRHIYRDDFWRFHG